MIDDDDEQPFGAARAGASERKPRARATEGPLWTRARESVAWSPKVARRLVARVAAGELLYAVLREADMPTPQSVGRWTKEHPEFGAALMAARRAGGRPERGGGGVWTYCEAAAREVFERLCEGESLNAIGADPTMPSVSTIFAWRRQVPEFAQTVRVGKEIQAEQVCADGWDMAMEATPETAYLTHVRLTQMRWMAGVMAPKTYRTKPAEPDAPREVLRLLIRSFKGEEDPVTGKMKVVAYCPNPETGQMEREDTPGYEYPPGQPMPAGARWA